MYRIKTLYVPVLAILVAGLSFVAPAAKADDGSATASAEIRELLAQVKTEATTLDRDAAELAAWTRQSRISWETHAGQLDVLREHINKAGKLLAQMQDARSTASPWQQQAIDRIEPLLQELADNTTSTINHLDENRSHLSLSQFGDFAKAGEDLARELSTLVGDYVEFGEHEANYHRMQEKLEASAS